MEKRSTNAERGNKAYLSLPQAMIGESRMFDYQSLFDEYCMENGLDLALSFDMPAGYETANGTFDVGSKTVFINADLLNDAPDHEKAYYLFHELRHAMQYLCPEQFGDILKLSLQYVIMYDGTCFKLIGGEYLECKMDGGEEYYTDLYLGQPNEVDANTFAYERARELYGDFEALRKLYEFWLPRRPVSDETYRSVYSEIDRKTQFLSDLAASRSPD